MKEPIFASCCRTILGCSSCVEQWQVSHTYCPNCRGGDFYGGNTQPVVGLDEAHLFTKCSCFVRYQCTFHVMFYSILN